MAETTLANTLWSDGEFTLARDESSPSPSTLRLSATQAQPSARSLQRLEHAFALRGELDSSWASRPIDLVHEDGLPTLRMEDPGGELLARLVGRPWELTAFLRVAIGLAASLGRLHQRGLVHKDIKPSHILTRVDTGQTWLTGFGLVSRAPRERQAADPPERIVGTLAYMAPEQTGRMNRSVDARSDLYACGVTLYEMLAGVLPFSATEPIEWIHCHVARVPVPLGDRVEGLPGAVDAIVSKLLSKNAEDRYQTAAGLEQDLKRCLTEWERRQCIDSFPLGDSDIPDQLHIPERLYGREREIEALGDAFRRVSAGGTPEVVLVSGYAGIGKSSVVHELHKVMIPPRGFFAAGKFDQNKRDVPCAALAQALQGIIRALLVKSEAELSGWRDAIKTALGPNGQLVVNLIPELALVVGPQPPVSELRSTEAQNRFQTVFLRFLAVFARPEHPLVLFLDDLQWLDASTFDLLDKLVTDTDARHLLLVGAYRDHEVGAAHPLRRSLAAIRASGTPVHELVLTPLGAHDIGRLISDTLQCDRERTHPLAERVHQKTDGNPFFAIQFLMALHDEGLLSFDSMAGRWTWDMPRLEAKGYTDNVVELMIGKLRRLPAETQNVLKVLACLGHRADAEMLARVAGLSPAALDVALWAAVRAGLVFSGDGSYSFLHDRVQEAAYSLLADEERAETHLRLGRLLMELPSPRREEEVFTIAAQLNRGAVLMTSPEERARAAELNLLAGTRAKAASAYVTALGYLAAGDVLLSDDVTSRAELRFLLALHRADCEIQTGALDAADDRLLHLSHRTGTLAASAAVTCLRVVLYMARTRMDLAVQTCLEFLRTAGIDWSAHPAEGEVRSACERISGQLGGRTIEDLVHLPLMDDPDRRGVMDVLCMMVPPAIETDMNLAGLVIARMANLSIEHGNTDASCYAYVLLNMVVGQRFGDHSSGYRFGQLSVDLIEQRRLKRFESRVVLCFGTTIVPWARPIRTGLPWIRRAFDAAAESGDFVHGAYSCNNMVTALLAGGDPMADVQREAEQGLAFVQKTGFRIGRAILTGQLLLIRSLRGQGDGSTLADEPLEERELERQLSTDTGLSLPACWYWIRKLQARFFSGDYAAAADAAAKAEALLWTSSGFFEAAEYHFYAALTRAAGGDGLSGEDRARQLDALRAHHQQLAAWAAHAPENFADRAALVAAEIARIETRPMKALQLYEEALRHAREQGFVQNEGLASERAAGFCSSLGLDTLVSAYLRNARYCYVRWGADSAVRRLDEAHPLLHKEGAAPEVRSFIGTSLEQIDLATVVAVSQTVSQEIRLDTLIETVMANALTHTGAERGALFVRSGDELLVEAIATTGSAKIAVSLHRRASIPAADVPTSVLDYVFRTKEAVILDDASTDSLFSTDDYVVRTAARSILGLPLSKQGALTGVLYLENRLTSRVFTPGRIAAVKLIASQAAISLENARLYADLQETGGFLAQAQRLSATGSFGWKPATGEIVWSEETYRIFGFDRMQRPTVAALLSLVHPGDRTKVQEMIDRAPQQASDWDLDYRLMLTDGGVKHLHVAAQAVRHAATGALEFVGAVMDVTAARQSHQALERAYSEIQTLKNQLQKENLVLKEEIEKTSMFEEIVGNAPVLRALLSQIAMVAPTDSTVLITGETGTGKELVARAIHKRSPRSGRAFVSVNCAAIPSALIASELFGHEKGAFTGALQRRQGRFELAEGGTIFLDEIGELSAETQVALLRVLQEQEFERVGGGRPIPTNVRVIAATNRDLRKAIADGPFRADLFYRLNVFPVEVPALRDRSEDVPLLVQYFTHRYATRAGKKVRAIPRRTLDLLTSYRWPGNIRELQNVIERAVIVSQGDTLTVDERWLFPESTTAPTPNVAGDPADVHLERKVPRQERAVIEAALAETRGRVAGPFGAADKLGLPPTTLESKIKALGIDKRRFKPTPPPTRS
jgi:transcriptional regulator with GAF, ATPase, and Fis domain/predicted ATPase